MPGATLLTAPDELTLATDVLVLDHVPPEGETVSVMPSPLHIIADPDMALGPAVTVTTIVA